MKKLLYILLCLAITTEISAQGITKYGQITTSSKNFVNKNGKIDSIAMLNKYGQRITNITIGQAFQGGIIAYIFQQNDPGYVEGEIHGLIAAPSDQSNGITWYNGSSILTFASAIALGTGAANTDSIVAKYGTGPYAAKLCYDLVLDGYNDWYLPSQDELNKLYLNKDFIGGFGSFSYWSSSEYNAGNSYLQIFSNGYQGQNTKGGVLHIRAIRSFNITLPTISTTPATSITRTSATSGGYIPSNGGSAIIARGICWDTNQSPTLANNFTSNGIDTGSYSSNLSGLSIGKTYYVRAYATNSAGTAYGNEVSFTADTIQNCGIISDLDGNIYKTVSIGTQCWMRENLKTTKYRNEDSIPNVTNASAWVALATGAYCNYNNDSSNVITLGRLYNWYSVNDSRNICPSGWHVPTDAEWTTLETFLGGSSIAGGKLKQTGFSSWASPNTGATNSTGFSALSGGVRVSSYGSIGSSGGWWSSTEYSASTAWLRFMLLNDSGVNWAFYSKVFGYSVRCIRDK